MALHVGVVVLEGVEELSKNLVLSLLTGLNLRVLLGIIRLADIIDIELARSVNVHNLVDLHDDVLTEGVHLTADGTKELIVGDGTGAISIEKVVDLSTLLISHANTEVMHSLDEFGLIKGAGSVVIGNLEFPTDGGNTTSTSLGKSASEVVNELLLGGIISHESFLRGRCGGSSAEDVVGSGSLRSSLGEVSSSLTAATDFTAPAFGAHALTRLSGEFPSVLNHELEVVVVIDGGRDVVIVLGELLLGHNIVGSAIVAHSMLSLESLKELLEDLILSLLASENFGVSVGSVDALDVVDINPTVVISIENIVGLHDDLLSGGVHGTADSTNELVELKETSLVIIEIVEQLLHLTLGETEHVISASLGELELVEGARVVVVHDLELSLEADEATGTTRDELLAHSLSELLRATHGRLAAGSSHRSTVKLRSELLVLDTTRGVEIVDVEESLKILLGGDHDTDLLNGLGEFIGLDSAGVVQVEILERLDEDLLLGSNARCLLLQLVLQFSLET
jgi:hypothetical protein